MVSQNAAQSATEDSERKRNKTNISYYGVIKKLFLITCFLIHCSGNRYSEHLFRIKCILHIIHDTTVLE